CVEALTQLSLDSFQRVVVGGSEAPPLERPAGQTDNERGDQAGARQARDDVHDALWLVGPTPSASLRRGSPQCEARRRPTPLAGAEDSIQLVKRIWTSSSS